MTLIVVTLLLLRLALIRDGVHLLEWIASGLALLGLLLVAWTAQRRIGAMSQATPTMVGRTLTVVALSVVGYAVLGILLVLA